MHRFDLWARYGSLTVCSLFVCSWLGCGGSGIPVVPATGIVLYKDKPLDNATVNFVIAGKDGQPSTLIGIGTTDKDGKFKIQTTIDPTSMPLDGAVEGTHQVTIHKYIPPKGMTEEELAKMMAKETKIMEEKGFVPPEDITPPRVPFLPAKYQNPTMSQLTAEVKRGEQNDFKFDLK